MDNNPSERIDPSKNTAGDWRPAPPDTRFPPQPHDRLATSELITSRTDMVVPSTGGDCDSNNCRVYDPDFPPGPAKGCAQCGVPKVRIPMTANLVAVRFYTTANAPDDHVYPQLVQPGDIAWSYYDGWGQVSSGQYKLIYAGYHNRSSNRARRIALEVDYKMP